MKNVLVSIAALVLVAGFTGCKSASTSTTPVVTPTPVTPAAPTVGCALETTLAAAISSGVASGLSCTHPEAIQADLVKAMGSVNLCPTVSASKKTLKVAKSKANEKGVLADVACPLIVPSLFKVGVSQIPAAWGCSGGTTVSMASDKVTALCKANISL